MANHPLNICGKKFGRLTAICIIGRDKRGHTIWKCRCDCGTQCDVVGARLTVGNTSSCGCYRKDRLRTHGISNTPVWNIWHNLIKRCYDKDSADYPCYGGRGITACNAIRETPLAIIEAIGNRPTGMSLDRIDTDGGYTCGNCPDCASNGFVRNIRWASNHQQQRNRRDNVWIDIGGRRQILTDWASGSGIALTTFRSRIKRGLKGMDLIAPPAMRRPQKAKPE